MSQAQLLLRENLSSNSLSNIVEKSQKVLPPFSVYELRFNSTQLDIISINAGKHSAVLNNSVANHQHGPSSNPGHPTDEGFDESDVDSLSLVSSEESFASSTCMVADHAIKNRENDSANGNSSSESDAEGGSTGKNSVVKVRSQHLDEIETFLLQNVLCYTDVTNPKTLVFVIKNDVLVFNFDNIQQLHDFYTSFNILKAVTNQRTYATTLNSSTKFNLVQRTDQNGVTHIEINRDTINGITVGNNVNTTQPDFHSNIISLQTPDIINFNTFKTNKNSHINLIKNNYHLSKDDLTSDNRLRDDAALKKVWKSAEDLLDGPNIPERPERKKKIKRMAPLPPIDTLPGGQNTNQNNVMKGQYIRVAVDPKKNITSTEKFVRKVEKHPMHLKTFSKNIQTFTPNWQNIPTPPNPLVLTTVGAKPPKYQFTSRLPDLKLKNHSDGISSTANRNNWTNSLPRILRKPRAKSETRFSGNSVPHKFIDTTLTKKQPTSFPSPTISVNNTIPNSNSSIISNRLFGLSQKLKEFGSTVVHNSHSTFSYHTDPEIRRNSCGDIISKNNYTVDSNLKSVIKKQDDRKAKNGNEKKVTFSAFATVQVV